MISEKIEFQGIEFNVKIGQNAQENWDLITSSSQNDIWFHLGGSMPSPHVVLANPENLKIKKIPRYVLSRCANLCKEKSKFNNINRVSVIYTEIKNVSKGDKVGSVYTKQTLSIII